MTTHQEPTSRNTLPKSAPADTSKQDASGSQAAQPTVRRVVTWLCLVAGLSLVGITYFPVVIAAWHQAPWLLGIFQHHYAAIFGLPGAGLLSFILVVVLEARFDTIEMEIPNLIKFRGASGPIILWVMCFLSMAVAIRILW